MTLPLKYDAARAAIAECKSYDEVREWADKAAALQEYARRAGDRSMEEDCAEIRVRAARRQGELIGELRAAGAIREGVGKETVTGLKRITLADLGIDRRESMIAQRIAAIPLDQFEDRLTKGRAEMAADKKRHTIDVLREGPVNGARSIAPSRQEPADSLDYFPTPPWATRALIEHCVKPLRFHRNRLAPLSEQSVWEPACGEGHMAEVLKEYFGKVQASDIARYGYVNEAVDFLCPETYPPLDLHDWIITNPPFGDRTARFVLQAIDLASVGVAMFVRLQWLESIGRYEAIFRDYPPTQICFFAERVPLCRGRWNPDGGTLTAYIWLIWIKGAAPRPPLWVPPGQREALTHPDDRERFTAHPVIQLDEPSEVTIRRQRNEWPDPMENWPVVRKESTNEPARAEHSSSAVGESNPVVSQDSRAGSPHSDGGDLGRGDELTVS